MTDHYLDAVRLLKEKTSFDAFESSQFAEYFFTNLFEGKPTSHCEKYDCLLKNGLRLEIKFSRAIQDKRIEEHQNHPRYFFWQNLRGLNNAKAGKVDYVVLVGYFDKYYVWIIPFGEIKNTNVEHTVYDKTGSNWKSHWINNFFVGDENDAKKYFENI